MIDSKVILHDIFYNTSMNLYVLTPFCTPLLCVVTYIGVYNTYLNGKCFLSTLYNDIICATPPQSKLLFVSISSHGYATSQNNFLCTDRHTSCRNTTYSVFAWPANTRDTAVVFLCQASAGNALLPVD